MCESFVPTGFRHTLTHTVCVHPLYPLVSFPPPAFSPPSHLYRWSDKTTAVMDVLDCRTFPTCTFGPDNGGRGTTLFNQGLVGGVTISRRECHGNPMSWESLPSFHCPHDSGPIQWARACSGVKGPPIAACPRTDLPRPR